MSNRTTLLMQLECCIYFFGRTDTINVIWRLSKFTGGGRPQVPLRALLHLSRTSDVP